MVSLVIYILSFVIIIGIVGTITTTFNKNIKDINMKSGTSSEYNKFNLYMLDQTQRADIPFGNVATKQRKLAM